MDPDEIVTVVIAALKATGSVAALSAIGVTLAWKGVLDRAGLKVLGALIFKLLIPCMTFTSIAGGMSYDFLRDYWGLCIFGAAMCGVGFFVGRVVGVLSGAPPAFKHWFALACAFPNIFAIPLVYIEAICRKEHDEPSASESCIADANTRLFTFIMLFPLVLYGFGGSYAMSCMAALEPATSLPDTEKHAVEVPQSAEAVEEPAKADANVFGKAANGGTQDAPVAVVPTASAPAVASSRGWRWQLKVIVLENPPVLATVAGIFVAMVPPVQSVMFGKAAPLQFITNAFVVVGKATACVSNTVMAASLGLQLLKCKRWTDVFGGPGTGISRRTLVTLVFAKMIIMPTVVFCTVWFLQGSLPEDRWYRLLLFMECATPTANNVVVLANILGDQDSAQILALTTISQFAIFLPISTLLTAVGLGVTDHLAV